MAAVVVETTQHLFLGMITSVFRAPISFFDTTPSSCMASHSPLFCSAYNFHLVPGKNCIDL